MGKARDLGKRGETVARDYLLGEGYQIIRSNFYYQRAEIDIIALTFTRLVIVEVKSRNSHFYEELSETVSKAKRQRLIRAADFFVREFDIQKEVRFDIIQVIFEGPDYRVVHIQDAFYPF